MLIEFKVSNYRSFREQQMLSMVANSGTEHRDTHTLLPASANFARVLASAALLGPNAAGKTNLLKALQCMQYIVINSSATNSTAPTAYAPFKFDILTQSAPTAFEATFIEGDKRYEYSFSIDAKRVYTEQY